MYHQQCMSVGYSQRNRRVDRLYYPITKAKQLGAIISTLLLTFILAACNSEYEESATPNTPRPGGGGNTSQLFPSFTSAELKASYERGGPLYDSQCVDCHGQYGSLGISLNDCLTCSAFSTLKERIVQTMPTGSGYHPSDCIEQCATDTAVYILAEFNNWPLDGGSLPPPSDASEELAASLKLDSSEETLRKASLFFGNRLPSEPELNSIRSAKNQGDKEEALAAAIDQFLNSDSFFIFLDQALNDLLLTDIYSYTHTSSFRRNAISLAETVTGYGAGVAISEFDSREWYYKYDGETQSHAMFHAAEAITKENFELLKYIIKNNRPITELLTADYMMVNWFSARAYGLVEGTDASISDGINNITFKEDPQYAELDIPYDPTDFHPIKNTGSHYIKNHFDPKYAPHSGILSSITFLSRYNTTPTNRNRHRARTVMDYFLNFDIIAVNGDRPEDDNIEDEHPTLTNESCYSCHNILDPIASAFKNWESLGRFRPISLKQDTNFRFYNSNNFSSWSDEHIKPTGFSGTQGEILMPDADRDTSLQWLAQEIVNDPRFAKAMTRWMFKSITGSDTLEHRLSKEEKESEAGRDALNLQRSFLKDAENTLKTHWNLKDLVKFIALSPYWRAKELANSGDIRGAYQYMDADQMLGPEMMFRKIKATTGIEWKDFDIFTIDAENLEIYRNDSLLNQRPMITLYGGIDSNNVTDRLRDPNGLTSAIQESYASDIACSATTKDFSLEADERMLFADIELSTTPSEANKTQFINVLQQLHFKLLGNNLSLNSAELEKSYVLLNAVWEQGDGGGTSIPEKCHTDTINEDTNYMITSWMAVLTYLISDYQFAFE